MSVIIDRRLNDRNKNAANRARFMRRYKAQIKRSVADMVSERDIKGMEKGGKVNLPARDVSEPHLRHGSGGDREMVLPGNRTFQPQDRLKRPTGGEGDGGGSGEGGSGEENFTFTLSREEFMNLFFDDLQLPHLLRTQLGDIKELKPLRAGFTTQGSPSNLSVVRTMRQALGRRIALRSGAKRRLQELESQQFDDPNSDQKIDNASENARLKKRIEHVPFLDDIDLRFRNRVMVPKPMTQAVMFCLMDVSASMHEQRKDLAKRFYTLLHLFLLRKYERVELVFIRHTDDADEVDEHTFFNDRKTGGTVVYSALNLMHEIVAARFPSDQWNVYAAQASDGDAFGADPQRSRGFLEEKLLPLVRYYAYIEVGEQPTARRSTLSSAYQRVGAENFAMATVRQHRDIYPVFRTLFSTDYTGSSS